MLARKRISCDLCVIGGGLSGMMAAIAAAREGLSVVLMHERPVLGGNASSEIRMWIGGAGGGDNRETGVLEEIALENIYRNPTKSYALWDTVLYDFVHREKNIQLLLNCTCMDAVAEKTPCAYGRDTRITSVTGYQMTTQTFFDVEATLFCDSSGDSILAPLCGAQFRIGREANSEFGEDTAVTVADNRTMGMSCLITGRETTQDVPFIPPTFATKLTAKDFENRNPNIHNDTENFWYLELGGDRNTIDDTETIRDELLGLALGTWDYIKNSNQFDVEKWDLEFCGFLPGKRESRRMCGEYMITQRDVSDGVVFDDEIAYGGWPIDDHFPGGFYHRGRPNTDIPTPAPYSIPYRSLYSKNVENLFFAGRNISMTHMAMSSMRVMATCALLGEAVGKAAAVAIQHNETPHDVYLNHITELQQRLMNEDCFLPSKTRPISELCRTATLTGADDRIRNGQDRQHQKLYGTDEEAATNVVKRGDAVCYRFAPAKIDAVHIVFSSDLSRKTLQGSMIDRNYTTRSNRKLEIVCQNMPKTLCRSFKLIGERDGVTTELLCVADNRKRAYHLPVNETFDTLKLVPLSDWGENEEIALVSFDFT